MDGDRPGRGLDSSWFGRRKVVRSDERRGGPGEEECRVVGQAVRGRLGGRSSDPEAAAVVSKNACSYPVRYEMESGLKRCGPRLSGPLTRASPCSEDLPDCVAPPKWFDNETLRDKWVAIWFRAQSSRSSLSDGYAYQFAAGASPLLFLVDAHGESRKQRDDDGSCGPCVGGARSPDDPGVDGLSVARVALAVAGVGSQYGV